MKHDRQGFITTFIPLAVHGETIRVFGDGSQLRDFTYVTDAVDAFLRRGADRGDVRAGAQRRRDRAGLAARGGGALPGAGRCRRHSRDEAVAGGAKIDMLSIYIDHSRLTELTGWEPMVGLREGLAETIRFYRDYGERYWA
jgi:nucleoside-diphosphate-sugar epimerase